MFHLLTYFLNKIFLRYSPLHIFNFHKQTILSGCECWPNAQISDSFYLTPINVEKIFDGLQLIKDELKIKHKTLHTNINFAYRNRPEILRDLLGSQFLYFHHNFVDLGYEMPPYFLGSPSLQISISKIYCWQIFALLLNSATLL